MVTGEIANDSNQNFCAAMTQLKAGDNTLGGRWLECSQSLIELMHFFLIIVPQQKIQILPLMVPFEAESEIMCFSESFYEDLTDQISLLNC